MVYLDHAASTTIRPAAMAAWQDAAMLTGNPSSSHTSGRKGRRMLEEAREQIAANLGVKPDAIFFTSGGTEADNAAVLGTVNARRREDPRRDVVIVSPIEHKAVLEPIEGLAKSGMVVEKLRVDQAGVVELDHLKALLSQNRGRIALVAVMWANNEVGSVQPIEDIVALCRPVRVPVHSDAVQAVGSPGLDLSLPNTAAMSGHKLGGPKGVGILIHQNRYPMDPFIRGGGQENGVRAGTLDVPCIVGMAAAVEEVFVDEAGADAKYRSLRDDLVAGVVDSIPDVVVNSDSSAGLPGLAHISFPGCEGDALMLLLDTAGVEVSVGSACSSGATKTSHVLRAMGIDEEIAGGSLRFSVGWSNTPQDVDKLLQVLPEAVARARQAYVKSPVEGA
jgi:cysteine desulfurase